MRKKETNIEFGNKEFSVKRSFRPRVCSPALMDMEEGRTITLPFRPWKLKSKIGLQVEPFETTVETEEEEEEGTLSRIEEDLGRNLSRSWTDPFFKSKLNLKRSYFKKKKKTKRKKKQIYINKKIAKNQ